MYWYLCVANCSNPRRERFLGRKELEVRDRGYSRIDTCEEERFIRDATSGDITSIGGRFRSYFMRNVHPQDIIDVIRKSIYPATESGNLATIRCLIDWFKFINTDLIELEGQLGFCNHFVRIRGDFEMVKFLINISLELGDDVGHITGMISGAIESAACHGTLADVNYFV